MANITGTVVSVSLETTVMKQDKTGTYSAWELVFRDADNKVSSIQKPVTGLKYTKGLKEGLLSLAPGDTFTCVMEKGKNGYLEVQSVTKGEFNSSLPTSGGSSPSAPVSSSSAPTGGRITGSTYETPAERAVKQRLIVRQSCLSNAIEFFEMTKGKPHINDVTELADDLCAWVFEVNQAQVPEEDMPA